MGCWAALVSTGLDVKFWACLGEGWMKAWLRYGEMGVGGLWGCEWWGGGGGLRGWGRVAEEC